MPDAPHMWFFRRGVGIGASPVLRHDPHLAILGPDGKTLHGSVNDDQIDVGQQRIGCPYGQ